MMFGGCSAAAADAATSFKQVIASSSAATVRDGSHLPHSRSATHIGGLRFLGRGGGNLSRFVCLPTNPVRAVASSSIPSSESQVQLEPIIEDHPQLPHQDNSRTVHVKIQLKKECKFGEQFFVVGTQPELGLWNPLDAVPMTWSDGHVWTFEMDTPIGELIQFKFLLRKVSGEFLWQPGQDRVLHTWETSNVISVLGDWETAEAQQVTEERDVTNKFEESDLLKTKQLEHSDEMYNDKQNPVAQMYEALDSAHSVACSNHKKVAMVAENITLHTKPDMDRMRSEEKISGVQDGSINAANEAAISDMGVITSKDILGFKEVPILVPGLNPCSTTPTEDVTAKEEQVKFEPHIFNIGSGIKPEKLEEQVKGHSGQKAATGRLSVNGEHAPMTTEPRSKEHGSISNEDFNDNRDQDLEYSLSEGENSKENGPSHDDIKWGSKTLLGFFNNLGFLYFSSSSQIKVYSPLQFLVQAVRWV